MHKKTYVFQISDCNYRYWCRNTEYFKHDFGETVINFAFAITSLFFFLIIFLLFPRERTWSNESVTSCLRRYCTSCHIFICSFADSITFYHRRIQMSRESRSIFILICRVACLWLGCECERSDPATRCALHRLEEFEHAKRTSGVPLFSVWTDTCLSVIPSRIS